VPDHARDRGGNRPAALAPVAALDNAITGKLTPEGAVERLQQWEEKTEEVPA